MSTVRYGVDVSVFEELGDMLVSLIKQITTTSVVPSANEGSRSTRQCERGTL